MKKLLVSNLVFLALLLFVGSGLAENDIIEPAGTEDPNDTFYGTDAGNGNSGNYATFVGAEAGSSGNSGESNTFMGQRTGWKNTSGASNTFVGRNAGA